MANAKELNQYTQNVRLIEPGDRVIGGTDAPINQPLQALANRTLYLKTQVESKIGNKGTQVIEGQLNIQTNAWEKIRFTNGDGSYWRFETAPVSEGENGARFNYVFTSGSREIGRVQFPRVSGSESVAYQSWVTEQIGALSIDSDLATRDLNTVTKAGLYGQTSSSNAQTSRNYPVVKAGSLLVMPSAYGVQQIYSVFDGTDIYARNQTGSGWTGWLKTNVSPGEMQSAVDTLERKLVNGSPAALDTIRELAAALGNDANFANKVLQQIAGKADKSSTRAGYGITDASEVAVLTGQLNHGGTIPLPPGYREDQCKWLVSMAEDDPNYTSWDISEGGLSKHYYYRCYTRGRTVIAKVYHGSSDQNPDSNYQGWVLGKVNYICIGVK